MKGESLRDRVVSDFGEQWNRYPDGGGYFDSDAIFEDIVSPLLSAVDFEAASVAEIGAGQGRFVGTMARLGAARILALEPSEAVEVLRRNTERFSDRITYLKAPGEALPAADFDLVLSIGVIHHIPDPKPVVEAAYAALRPGGRFFMWVYGREGNRLYLALAAPLRRLSSWLSPGAVAVLSYPLAWALSAYAFCCRFAPLPLHSYMRRVIAPLAPRHRRLVVFDQLNPAWSKYYTREESVSLLESAGFCDVQSHRRHGYSWSVVGVRPSRANEASAETHS